MPEPRKIRIRLLPVLACILVLVAVVVGLRRAAHDEPPAGEAAGSARHHAEPATADSAPRSRGQRPPHGEVAPSRGASQAVAALVGDSSLSDLEVVDGLRRIVDDAGRPLDERLEALDHALNLIPNDNPAVLHEIAGRRILPDEVRMRIVAEALNRPARLQGELLVQLLENAAGEARDEILSQLAGLCGEDLGDHPAAWRGAIEKLPDGP